MSRVQHRGAIDCSDAWRQKGLDCKDPEGLGSMSLIACEEKVRDKAIV